MKRLNLMEKISYDHTLGKNGMHDSSKIFVL